MTGQETAAWETKRQEGQETDRRHQSQTMDRRDELTSWGPPPPPPPIKGGGDQFGSTSFLFVTIEKAVRQNKFGSKF